MISSGLRIQLTEDQQAKISNFAKDLLPDWYSPPADYILIGNVSLAGDYHVKLDIRLFTEEDAQHMVKSIAEIRPHTKRLEGNHHLFIEG